MNKIKEEFFRIKGKVIANFHIQSYSAKKMSLITLHFSILNKQELQELINWLISKTDEME